MLRIETSLSGEQRGPAAFAGLRRASPAASAELRRAWPKPEGRRPEGPFLPESGARGASTERGAFCD